MSESSVIGFARDVPPNLKKDLIYHTNVSINRNNHYDLILTQGPVLYEIQKKQILAYCDLSGTVLTGDIALTI